MREILTSIRRSPYQSLSAFLVLFFTLFLSLTMIVVLSFLHGILGYVETKPQVIVYFKPKTDEKQIFKIREELISSGKVLSASYVSQKQAFKTYEKLNKDNPLLLEMVSPEILPPSLEINANKPNYLSELSVYLKNKKGVDEVVFQKDIVDKLLTLTNIIKKGSIIFFSFLIIMSAIVLITTTLFKIALHKEEIELLRLLGASHLYIQKPFILEGVFFGFFASLSSFLVLLGIFFYLNPFLSSYLRGIPQLTVDFSYFKLVVWPVNINFSLIIFGTLSLFGMIIATISTLFATEKYLD